MGPIVGGFLQAAFVWKSGFWFSSIFIALLTVFVFLYIPENIAEK